MGLIEPDELEKVLRPILTDESCPLHIAAEIDMNIELMPKVDAVPVVRCRDCEHKDRESGFCHGRGWPMQLVPDDGFCDKGERKGESDEH